MRIKRNSWLLKWAYFDKGWDPEIRWFGVDSYCMPDKTSTCHLFWRTFVATPVYVLMLLIFLPVAGIAYGIGFTLVKLLQYSGLSPGARLLAITGRMCPVIDVTDEMP